MKIIIVFILYIIAAYAVFDFEDEVLEKSMIDCIYELGLDPGLINTRDANEKIPTPAEQGCIINCIYQKFGVVHENGTVNYSFFNRRNNWKIFEPFINNCTATVGGNACALSACIHNFTKDY